jgi:hypothetical protein
MVLGFERQEGRSADFGISADYEKHGKYLGRTGVRTALASRETVTRPCL